MNRRSIQNSLSYHAKHTHTHAHSLDSAVKCFICGFYFILNKKYEYKFEESNDVANVPFAIYLTIMIPCFSNQCKYEEKAKNKNKN